MNRCPAWPADSEWSGPRGALANVPFIHCYPLWSLAIIVLGVTWALAAHGLDIADSRSTGSAR